MPRCPNGTLFVGCFLFSPNPSPNNPKRFNTLFYNGRYRLNTPTTERKKHSFPSSDGDPLSLRRVDGSVVLDRLDRLALAQAELARVVAVGLEELAEASILVRDGVLVDAGDEEEDEGGGQDAKAAGNPEGVLGRLDLVATGILDEGEDVGPDERTDLASGRRNTVVT